MKKQENIINDDRLKSLFKKIENDIPGNDFTINIMQKITSEKIAISPKRSNKLIFWLSAFFLSFIMLAGVLLVWPETILWAQFVFDSIKFPTLNSVDLKSWEIAIQNFYKSLNLTPSLLAIVISCSVVISLFIGVTGFREPIKN